MGSEYTCKPILILGIGNILLSDEGIGVHVVERLKKIPLPENVEVIDGGTSGVDLLDILAEREKIIVVDAVDTGYSPGTILRFGIDQLNQKNQPDISMHEIGIAETIFMTKQLGCGPKEVVVFGIQPQSLECGLTLSKSLEPIVQDVVELIFQELRTVESTINSND